MVCRQSPASSVIYQLNYLPYKAQAKYYTSGVSKRTRTTGLTHISWRLGIPLARDLQPSFLVSGVCRPSFLLTTDVDPSCVDLVVAVFLEDVERFLVFVERSDSGSLRERERMEGGGGGGCVEERLRYRSVKSSRSWRLPNGDLRERADAVRRQPNQECGQPHTRRCILGEPHLNLGWTFRPSLPVSSSFQFCIPTASASGPNVIVPRMILSLVPF